MAYVLGFMFADGSLLDTNASSRTYYLQFSNTDLRLLQKIRTALQSQHAIYTHRGGVMKHKPIHYTAKTSYVLRFGNKVMYHDLLSLGMSHRKSNTMQLPKVPDNYFSYFLRGYFDGDGCFYTTRDYSRARVIFTSGSMIFLHELGQKLHAQLDVPEPRLYRSIGSYNLCLEGRTCVPKLLDYMYHDLSKAPFLHRKYRHYREYIHTLIRRMNQA